MKSVVYIGFFYLICVYGVTAQVQDETRPPASVQTDTIPESGNLIDLRELKFSADTLDAEVDYGARDSIRYENEKRLVYLYGEAFIKYLNYVITADYIVVDLENNIAEAEQLPDSLKSMTVETPEEIPDTFTATDSLVQGNQTAVRPGSGGGLKRSADGKPLFEDGDQQFEANRIRYNFQTRKGKVYDIVTQESQMFLHGAETKFISSGEDTARRDIIYSTDVLLTTCDAPHPHFGIRSRKQKVIPNRQVIIGPSNLEIAEVPTPLFLPFGFFPLARGAKNGLIFPQDFEFSQEWGFGLRDVGYYFPINDYWDLEITGDIYFKGSWGIRTRSNYRKRYQYTGNLDLAFSNRIREIVTDEGVVQNEKLKSLSINWSHNQDNRAHPHQSFSASVRMQTNGFEQLNYNDADRVLNNQYSSNVSFRRNFPRSPFSLSANVRHSQNTLTNDIQFTLPDVNVNMNRIFPFKNRKVRSPDEKWYEKISFQYSGKFLNRIRTKDTLLFEKDFLAGAEFGFNHDINSSASFRILRFFNITPSVDYEESWYFSTINKAFDPEIDIRIDTVYNQDSSDFTIVLDTLTYGKVLRDTVSGFKPLRQYSANISLTTQIFGTWLRRDDKPGWLRGLRHVIKPSISFNFAPDYTSPSLGYVKTVQRDIRPEVEWEEYSIFEGALFGAPPRTGRRMALSYSLTNIFEAKVFSRRDSTEKNVKLFNNIFINGNYNFAADSLPWSPISLSGNTSLFGGLTSLTFSAGFDLYAEDELGRRINKFYYDTDGKLLRFMGATFRISTGLTVGSLKELILGTGKETGQGSVRRPTSQGIQPEEESLIDIFQNFRLNHNLVLMWDEIDGRNRLEVRTNSINTNGAIPLTPKWNISVGNIGYDFTSRRITYPYLGFTRDLHCWEMSFNWAPQRGTYSFHLRVRQQPLNIIKIPFQKNRQDTRAGAF